ncbi:hypothetical protein [Arthrobacter mobilis]|uniref:Uncharacterized protein n=1 Tax=Arthrobacter mobilis TaxID=2724944 RepID=A0A7X6HG20_9MICC|nr:hypothetical protein [Arthrobacter mobilis]NKX55356.1 hypothetical protein [Arthrobacter mobilis]
MKFDWQGNTDTGGSAIVAQPERYDAVPFVNELLIDGRPRVVSGDRFAVAAALAFGQETSGSMDLPFPLAPATAQAIQQFLHPTWVNLTPIEYVPKALPIGINRLHLTVDGAAAQPIGNTFDKQRTIHFDLRRSDRYAGQLMSLDHHVVVSNAWMFGEPDSKRSLCAALAVAVLFAESLQVDAIEFPALMTRPDGLTDSINALLQSCRLALA